MAEKIKKLVSLVFSFLTDGMWKIDVDSINIVQRVVLKTLRFFYLTLTGFVEHRCSLHAAGLTYFSILSVVPVLLLMLLLTKPCGMYDWSREKLRVKSDQMIENFFEANHDSTAAGESADSQAGANERAAGASAKGNEGVKAGDAKVSEEGSKSEKSGVSFAVQARELRNQILSQIDEKINNFNFGLLALVGLGVLAWTVISTIGQVESSFNDVWNVRKNRPIHKKACLYVGTLMVLPLLTGLAMSVPVLRLVKIALDATLGSMSYTKWVGDAIVALLYSQVFSFFVAFAFSSLAMAFLFKAMPNCKVTFRSALEGGALTAIFLDIWLRLCSMLQFGISNSSAAYGSFALIPILIVWIFMSWKIILLGSSMTYAFQCVHSRVRSLSCE